MRPVCRWQQHMQRLRCLRAANWGYLLVGTTLCSTLLPHRLRARGAAGGERAPAGSGVQPAAREHGQLIGVGCLYTASGTRHGAGLHHVVHEGPRHGDALLFRRVLPLALAAGRRATLLCHTTCQSNLKCNGAAGGHRPAARGVRCGRGTRAAAAGSRGLASGRTRSEQAVHHAGTPIHRGKLYARG